jgi:hypothetical protein
MFIYTSCVKLLQLAYVGSDVTSGRVRRGKPMEHAKAAASRRRSEGDAHGRWSTRTRVAGVHELVYTCVEACTHKLLQAKNQAARSPALEPDQHAWMEVTGDQQLAIEALVTRVGLLVLHSIHQ